MRRQTIHHFLGQNGPLHITTNQCSFITTALGMKLVILGTLPRLTWSPLNGKCPKCANRLESISLQRAALRLNQSKPIPTSLRFLAACIMS